MFGRLFGSKRKSAFGPNAVREFAQSALEDSDTEGVIVILINSESPPRVTLEATGQAALHFPTLLREAAQEIEEENIRRTML